MLTNANLKHRCNAFCYVLQVRSRLTTVPVVHLLERQFDYIEAQSLDGYQWQIIQAIGNYPSG